MCLFCAVRQRDEWERRRKVKVKRERGWTGNSWGGISLGSPDPGPNGGNIIELQFFSFEILHGVCLLIGIELDLRCTA